MFKVGQRVWLVEEKKYAKITKVDDITYFDKVAYDIEIENDNYIGYWRFGRYLHETADDMFEKLGYEKKRLNLTFGCVGDIYNYKQPNNSKVKEIFFRESDNQIEIKYDTDDDIVIKEHLAIHQKLIELGWL